jgi:hypothetical protein
MARKTIELMNLPELLTQFGGCNAIAEFPASAIICFAKRKTHEASFCKIRIAKHALMWQTVKHQVLIDFVA